MPSVQLRDHGRFPYSAVPGRPTYTWPDGRHLAVYVALNLEVFSFGEGLIEELVPSGGQPDVLNHSWCEYGNRVGAWRLLELFEQLEIPSTLLVNSELYAHCPDLIAAFRRRGDEIACHGRTNSERQGHLSEEDERDLIEEATRTLTSHEGTPPTGWLSPWISESFNTPDLLKEAGYRYVLDWAHDDQPTWLTTRSGPLLSVPYPQELNDSSTIVGRLVTARQFAEMIADNFDEMLEQAGPEPLAMGIALHANVAGQPFRLRPLRAALRKLSDARERFWWARAGDVAAHVEEVAPSPS